MAAAPPSVAFTLIVNASYASLVANQPGVQEEFMAATLRALAGVQVILDKTVYRQVVESAYGGRLGVDLAALLPQAYLIVRAGDNVGLTSPPLSAMWGS